MPRLFRIVIPVDTSTGSAILHASSRLAARQNPQGQTNQDNQDNSNSQNGISGDENKTGSGSSGGTSSNTIAIIIIACSAIGFVLLVCLFLFLRYLRARNATLDYLPKPFKKLWNKWDVHPKAKYTRTSATTDELFQRHARMREAQDNLEDALHDAIAQQEAAANSHSRSTTNVNRNTSVRSVMTLPAYRPKAAETEQVIGREGERDGIDRIVELPTAEEDENMREDEMEALYQIRLARRRQIAEREQRRQERREARERHDPRALEEIRNRARLASTQAQREVEELRDAHEALKQSRQRAVSSVSYHDVGLVRADGTRLRANSQESERMGLLSDAASIALSAHEGAGSLQHRRATSAQSILSIDTFRSNQTGSGSHSGSPGMGPGHSRASSRGQLGERRGSALSHSAGSALSQRAGSSPELIDAAEADLGDVNMPLHSPPGYDDVSLEELTPAGSHQSAESPESAAPSGRASPYTEPPPGYPGQQEQGPTQARQNRLSAHMADLAEQQRSSEGQTGQAAQPSQGARHSRAISRGVGGVPQLPSLRLNRLPQIVIEPTSALSTEEYEERR